MARTKCVLHRVRNCPHCNARQASIERGLETLIAKAKDGLYNPEDVSSIEAYDKIDRLPLNVLQGTVHWLRENYRTLQREYADGNGAFALLRRWETVTVYRLMGWGGAEVAAGDPRRICMDREDRERAEEHRKAEEALQATHKPSVTGEFETAAALSGGIQG